MRVFIAVLVLIFSLQSWTRADDISEFEIEGMSVGDSLLDYFSEKEIKKKKKEHYYPNKEYYASDFTSSEFEIYELVQVHWKTNDKNYIIKSIDGIFYYDKNPKGCYKKMDEIVAELSDIFINAIKDDDGIQNHPVDKSGKSKTKTVYFYLNTGEAIQVGCADYSDEFEKKNSIDHLRVSVNSNEIMDWFANKAYKTE